MSTRPPNDLWPEDLLSNIPIMPVRVLKEQAALLGSKTQNLLEGRVKTEVDSDGDFIHSFEIHAPTLKYRYELFQVWHGVVAYPVQVMGDGEKLEDEAKLKAYIARVLGADNTKAVIRSLVSQLRG